MNTYGPLLTPEAAKRFENYVLTITDAYVRRDEAGHVYFDVSAPVSPGVALQLENLVAALGPAGAAIRQAAGLPVDDGPLPTGDGIRLSARRAYWDSTRPAGKKFFDPTSGDGGNWSPWDV